MYLFISNLTTLPHLLCLQNLPNLRIKIVQFLSKLDTIFTFANYNNPLIYLYWTIIYFYFYFLIFLLISISIYLIYYSITSVFHIHTHYYLFDDFIYLHLFLNICAHGNEIVSLSGYVGLIGFEHLIAQVRLRFCVVVSLLRNC